MEFQKYLNISIREIPKCVLHIVDAFCSVFFFDRVWNFKNIWYMCEISNHVAFLHIFTDSVHNVLVQGKKFSKISDFINLDFGNWGSTHRDMNFGGIVIT